jgi:hypothetical protein
VQGQLSAPAVTSSPAAAPRQLRGSTMAQVPALALSTSAAFVLFFTAFLVGVVLWSHARSVCRPASFALSPASTSPTSSSADASALELVKPHAVAHKRLSQPLTTTLSSVSGLVSELCRLGSLLLLIYMCENHPLFSHSQKDHDMDMLWLITGTVVLLSLYSVRKGGDGSLLNREQTEEWKGWMQIMFLLYHYYSAHEIYNGIRVMITCYVWMTGFGNFSFFYLKQDYSLIRFLQMLWRLNFLVLMLCMTLNNTYILYYICPLHTFYFLFVYAAMRIGHELNYSYRGVIMKLMCVALVVYLVWDADIGLFQVLFGFLGTEPKLGAPSGTLWEWYFRTSLDHWSALLGMTFALSYPVSILWLQKVEKLNFVRRWVIRALVASVFLALFSWWAVTILPLAKLEYNSQNAYFGFIIPGSTYLFLRNLTPSLRLYYSDFLHSVGKITLETYLMQHHVWLTSNAKTLLTLVPGLPKLNFLVCTCLYVSVSKEMYRLTMSLRGMLLPDSLAACLRNLAGLGGAIGVAYTAAAVVHGTDQGLVGLVFASTILCFFIVLAIHQMLRRMPTSAVPVPACDSQYDGRLLRHLVSASAAALLCLCVVAISRNHPWGGSLGAQMSSPVTESAAASLRESDVAPLDEKGISACIADVNKGSWMNKTPADCGSADGAVAFCALHGWRWESTLQQKCGFHQVLPDEFYRLLADRDVVFMGDSIERYLYHSAVRAVGGHSEFTTEKHQDLTWTSTESGMPALEFQFRWLPLARNIKDALVNVAKAPPSKAVVLLLGNGLWDALHIHDFEGYATDSHDVRSALEEVQHALPASSLIFWVKTTTIVEGKLTDEEKRTWLTNVQVDGHSEVQMDAGILDFVDGVIDGSALTASLDSSYSIDGVHYIDAVYDTMTQMWGNILAVEGRNRSKAHAMRQTSSTPGGEKTHPRVGSMSNRRLGMMVVAVIAIILFSMDAYLGVPSLILRAILGLGIGWKEAYGPLLRKLGKSLPTAAHPHAEDDGGASARLVGGGSGAEAASDPR